MVPGQMQLASASVSIPNPGLLAKMVSAQIWALLTLESWLRQEKGWGARRPAA